MVQALVLATLTWLHVFCAMGWFGGDLVLMIGLDPKLGRLSPSARNEFITRVFPGINVLEMAFSGSTVVFGAVLLYAMVGGDMSLLSPSNSWGLAVTVGAALALLAFLLEVAVHSPATRKVIAIAKAVGQGGQPAPAEDSKYEKRAEMTEAAIVLLLFLAFSCMIAAGQL